MKQHEAVVQAMRENDGYATLAHLYRTVPKIPNCDWKTKTPFASIRRIVQTNPSFFRIRPGLWALTEERASVLNLFSLTKNASPEKAEKLTHSYYQGLIVEIGNLKGYETFVPRQDKNKPFLAKRLGDVATLDHFYEFTYGNILRRGKTIDVTWFSERRLPNAFFEVEHSTDIQNSLLKFLDFQDFRINLRIVADSQRRREFEAKIGYSAFSSIRSLVRFIDYESLSNYHSRIFEYSGLEKSLGL